MPDASPLIEHLLALDDSGPDGFEGLARDLMQAVLGGTWRLQKAGTQHGADTVHESGQLVAEAKKYNSRLPLDQLKAKLNDAIGSRPDLTLWVLVTTRGVSGDDERELVKQGEREGVTVVVIDHAASPAAPSRIEVLCGCAPDVVRAHGPLSPTAEACLNAVAADTEAKQAFLQGLSEAEIGFTIVQRTTTAHLRKAMGKREEARHHLRSPADLLAQAWAPRPNISAALSGWWASGAAEAAVLLGEEGLGKTWAALGWWLDTTADNPEALPPTLVVPAQCVPSGDLGDVLGDALHKATGRRTPAFWARRAVRLVNGGAPPRLLLVLDGLNQAWSVPLDRWRNLLTEARAEPWSDRVAVLLSCRPDYWTATLGGMMAVEPAPRVINVPPFTPEERDALLASVGQNPATFDARVLELMRVPRLCRLAMTHAKELARSGDVTRERLIAIDWRERLKIHGETLIGLTEFNKFAALLGQSVRDALEKGDCFEITRADLVAELGRDSGKGKQDLIGTLSEIIEGRWLRKEGTHRFTVSPELTPFVLGLALVRHLDRLSEEEAVRERLADFMDPLNGQDFAVDILAAAVTVALYDENATTPIIDVLLDAWVAGRNFGSGGFETWWRLAAGTPEPFLDQAERWWRRREGGREFDDLFVKGLANAAQRSESAMLFVVTRIRVWLAQLWEEPHQGERLSKVEDKGTQARRDATRAAFSAYEVLRTHHPSLPELHLNVEEDGWPWLSYRAFAVVSLLPRKPFIPGIVAWAIARALAGSEADSGCRTRAGWVLRLNPEDPLEARRALETAVAGLREVGEPPCLAAADLLLDCAGLAPPPPVKAVVQNWQKTVTWDSGSGRVEWDDATARTWGRCESTPFAATTGLAHYAIDPVASLSDTAVERLRDLAFQVAPQIESNGADACGLNTGRLALARWAPEALVDYLGRRLQLLGTPDVPRRTGLLQDIPSLVSVLDREAMKAVRAAVPEPSVPKHWAHLPTVAPLLLDLHGKSAADQIERLARAPLPRPAVKAISFLLTPLDEPDYEILTAHLDPAQDPVLLQWWLEYLKATGLGALPSGYAPVAALLEHETAEVRTAAFNAASSDPTLRQRVADSGWSAKEVADMCEVLAGSGVLLEATPPDAPTAFADRLSPDALSVLVTHFTDSGDVLDLYSASLEERLEKLLGAKSRKLGSPVYIENTGARIFATRRPEEAIALLERFGTGRASRLFHPGWPAEGLCQALLEVRPQVGAQRWQAEAQAMRKFGISNREWWHLPFRAPDSPEVIALRAELIHPSVARTDDILASFALAYQEGGNQDWLIAQIRDDLGDPVLWRRARGLSLAAFLDQSDIADRLWADIDAAVPAYAWLAEVQAWAGSIYRRNVWARHWMGEWIAAPDELTAFGRQALLAACLDHRADLWLRDMLRKAQPSLSRQRLIQWDGQAEQLSTEIRERWREHKGTLFGGKVGGAPCWPWL